MTKINLSELRVFSTSVEVFLKPWRNRQKQPSLLHVRGGVSMWVTLLLAVLTSSPRSWRCFESTKVKVIHKRVFSTSVEVFPSSDKPSISLVSLLHVRGGVSGHGKSLLTGQLSSPRPWRCFRPEGHVKGGYVVFSTSVEVFLEHSFLL